MPKVPFLDLRVRDESERRDILEAIDRMLEHGRVLLGPEVGTFEEDVARRVGTRYALGCNSGTDALILALKTLRIGPGDEVIVPALSFVASANAIAITGATPVFADIGYDLNLSLQSVERLITRATKAIMPVHWAGLMCDMNALAALAREANLFIVEDSSQAFDATIDGRKAGSFSSVGCFSMNSMKAFASLGEAGMIVTNDPALHERSSLLRYHGVVNREYCVEVAQNSRLDTIQAAVLGVRLKLLDGLIEKRRTNAAYLDGRLSNYVGVPKAPDDARHIYYTYTIQTERRDDLQRYLADHDIETKIQHPLLMSQHPVYVEHARGEWTNANERIKHILCLPSNEKLSLDQLAYVADKVVEFFQR